MFSLHQLFGLKLPQVLQSFDMSFLLVTVNCVDVFCVLISGAKGLYLFKDFLGFWFAFAPDCTGLNVSDYLSVSSKWLMMMNFTLLNTETLLEELVSQCCSIFN